jgi:hypothetical protein
MSIALDKLVLGPGTPSIMQYAFTAISLLLYAEVENENLKTGTAWDP